MTTPTNQQSPLRGNRADPTATVANALAINADIPKRFSIGNFSSRFTIIGVWLLLGILFGVLEPKLFLSAGNIQTIFGSQYYLLFLTAALLCTIIVGEFVDMSVASNFGFAAVFITVFHVDLHWNVWVAALGAIVLSTAVGALNGWLTVFLGVNTIVATLGMGTFLLGIGLWVTNSMSITGLPPSFGKIELYEIGGLPLGFYEGIFVMLVFAYIMWFTPLGRNMRFVGAGREVARLAGIRVGRLRFSSFLAAGLIAGLGGVITAAGGGGWTAGTEQSYQLPIFAAVFLGTAVIEPGKFSPLGTVVAVFFLETGINGLQLFGLADWVGDVFYGGALVVAVALSTVLRRRA